MRVALAGGELDAYVAVLEERVVDLVEGARGIVAIEEVYEGVVLVLDYAQLLVDGTEALEDGEQLGQRGRRGQIAHEQLGDLLLLLVVVRAVLVACVDWVVVDVAVGRVALARRRGRDERGRTVVVRVEEVVASATAATTTATDVAVAVISLR